MSNYKFTEQEEIDYICSLDNMCTIGWSEQKNLLIQVHPSEYPSSDFYFKLFDASSENKARRIARIDFFRPVYILPEPKFNRGKAYWWLNDNDKRELNAWLDSINTCCPRYTNWEYAILRYNVEKGMDYEDTRQNLLSEGRLAYPEYLPFDLKRPDYGLLTQLI